MPEPKNPKSRKVHINISLTQEALDILAAEAARQDRSRSWIIEWAVKKALDPAQQPKPALPYYVPPLLFGEMPPITCGPADPHSKWDLDGTPKDELPVGMARNWKGLPE